MIYAELERPMISLAHLERLPAVDVYHYMDAVEESHFCQDLPGFEGHKVCYASVPPIYALPYTRLKYGNLRKALIEGWMAGPTRSAAVLFLRNSHQVHIMDRASREMLVDGIRSFTLV